MNSDERGYRAAKKAVEVYAQGNRDLCWGSMIYVCLGDSGLGVRDATPACGHREPYWLGVGVEGPPDLRKAVLDALKGMTKRGWEDGWSEELAERLKPINGVSYIPSPFIAGRCPQCRGRMQHGRWGEDTTFQAMQLAPPHVRYFRVPDDRLAQRWANEGYGGAELVERRLEQEAISRG